MLLVGAAAAVAARRFSLCLYSKLTGNMFFESAAEGPLGLIAKEVGFDARTTAPPEASVANQCRSSTAPEQGFNAISVSSLSPTGLSQALQNAKKRGVKVVTWDSDVDPKDRAIYVNQGTPEILGAMLVDMAYDQMNDEQKKSAKFAFFYSSPTVTDQNAWVDFAKKYIAEKHPLGDADSSVRRAGRAESFRSPSILQTKPRLDAITAPTPPSSRDGAGRQEP